MANKNRILYLLQYLQSHSDEDQAVSTSELRQALKEKGCSATVETLRDDIAALREVGFDIAVNEANGCPTTYSFVDRALDVPELQILIDAVSSSQFISMTRSRQLIAKLIAMAGPSHREELKPGIMTSESVKTPNSHLLYTVQRIQQAIQRDQKITFQYYQFNLAGERVPRHDGKWYVISPHATIWKHERYFVVGWSDERQRVVVFRIDRMGIPQLMRQPRVSPPGDFDVRSYTERIFNMYDEGDLVTVTLRCKHPMIDHIIDYFSRDVEPFNVTDETFDVNVRVSVAPTFFSWLAGYACEMTIVAPERVREEYRQMLQRGLDSLLSGGFADESHNHLLT